MKEFDELVDIMATLRSEKGCPWDREQTHQSLVPYMIEETYETIETIEENDPGKLCEELGDLLLQIVFHAQIAREHSEFTVAQVIEGICAKLIRRHPHVFGDAEAKTPQDVLRQWNEIKKQERAEKPSPMKKSPRDIPTLRRVYEIQDLLGKEGFKETHLEESLKVVEEALDIIKSDPGAKSREQVERMLFHLVNIARHQGVDPEHALKCAIMKTERDFWKWHDQRMP